MKIQHPTSPSPPPPSKKKKNLWINIVGNSGSIGFFVRLFALCHPPQIFFPALFDQKSFPFREARLSQIRRFGELFGSERSERMRRMRRGRRRRGCGRNCRHSIAQQSQLWRRARRRRCHRGSGLLLFFGDVSDDSFEKSSDGDVHVFCDPNVFTNRRRRNLTLTSEFEGEKAEQEI